MGDPKGFLKIGRKPTPKRNVVERVQDYRYVYEPMPEEDLQVLRHTVARHEQETGSTVARDLLADWSASGQRFTKVMPTDYKRVLLARARALEAGLDADAAVMEAVNG